MSDRTPTSVSVLYPMVGTECFEHEYYVGSYMPLVQARWQPLGLTAVHVLRGVPGPDGMAPAFRVIALLGFTSSEAFQAAAVQHAAEIFGGHSPLHR
jgi:hypothetical protein